MGFLMMIVREVLAIVRPILLSLVTAGIARPSEANMEAAAAKEKAKEP